MSGKDRISFTLGGKSYSLTRQGVEEAVAQAKQRGEIEQVTRHFAVIDGTDVPVKQAFGLATGLNRLDFTTAQARQPLRKLGFQLGERKLA
jgi:hypothetical protein